jgi:hypothetical protein
MTAATIPSFETEESSVSTLAQLAMHLSGADGYALYALDKESGALIVQCNAGASVPRPQDLAISNGIARRPGIVVLSYPLRLEGSLIGTLAFAFRGDSVPGQRIEILDRMARAVESVYCLPHSAARLFDKINRAETELATSKIAARARGILGGASADETLARIALVEQHVEHAVQSWRLKPILEDLLQEAEQKVSERKLASQAKTILQDAYGMSEEEAHRHLRHTSRRTQRPVREVAQRLIERIAETEGQIVRCRT